ncbi:DUF5074 domain-containing protein [Sediminibacter sp. Hel_I_10]|uniref:DUF5074 domain-containing protein n=1 Tax=Sediminibacter sp. Hel_I_10 TaxID=1392490 RepID=UPI000478FB49|nr:DUF5074 domain-containing protein [Sediminibacter sp. Hel_I_10]
MTKKLFVLAFLAFTCLSCSNDDDLTPIAPRGDYENGLLITHEGNFGQGNASISYVSNDYESVENDIFGNVNARALGDTAQSMAFEGDFAYIILSGSNKIEVVNRYTFESVATIETGLSNPRYMTISNGKGYVTNWGDYTPATDDFVAVVDLTLQAVVNTISCSYLPEELITVGNKIFVATGIYGEGNQVDVINTLTDELETSITVGNSPNSLQVDDEGDVWVLSSENLVEIDTVNNELIQTIAFSDGVTSPSDLNFDNGNFYFYAGGSVYKMSASSSTFPTTAEFDSLSFDDMQVKDGLLYGLDALDYASNGVLSVYDLNTNAEVFNHTLGIIPGGVYFN